MMGIYALKEIRKVLIGIMTVNLYLSFVYHLNRLVIPVTHVCGKFKNSPFLRFRRILIKLKGQTALIPLEIC